MDITPPLIKKNGKALKGKILQCQVVVSNSKIKSFSKIWEQFIKFIKLIAKLMFCISKRDKSDKNIENGNIFFRKDKENWVEISAKALYNEDLIQRVVSMYNDVF